MRYFSLLFLLMASANVFANYTLTLVQDNVTPGSTVTVELSNNQGLSSNAWIGVIPSSVKHGSTALNDKHDISYQYTYNNRKFHFSAPGTPGKYDLRLSDDNEKASVTFTVIEIPTDVIKLGLNNDFPFADHKINVTLSSPYVFGSKAWIGIFPANASSDNAYTADNYDLSYEYVPQKKSHAFQFRAPQHAGNYEVRLYPSTDRYGKLLAALPFKVKLADSSMATMSIPKTQWAGGAEIPVEFKANKDFSDRAWIGVIPSKIKHGDANENDRYDTDYQYLEHKTEGTALLRTPNKLGKYDLRMHDTNNGREVAHISFEVTHILDTEYLSKKITTEGKVTLQGIYFDTNKATLKPESNAVLDNVAALLKEQSQLTLIINGHTDNEGDDQHNLALSEKRAQSVKTALVTRNINANRLSTKGHGETQPVASNATATGRSLNRRVELSKQ